MPIAYYGITDVRTRGEGLGDFNSDVMNVVTNYAYGASNYGEAEYAKVLAVTNPQYQNYFAAQQTAQAQALNIENNLSKIQALVKSNYPNVNAYVVRAISSQSFGTNRGVFKLTIATDARGHGQSWEFDQDLPPDVVFGQMRTYLSAATGTVPLAASGAVANSSPANSVSSATSQVGNSSATNANNYAQTTGSSPTNTAAASSNGVFSYVSYGGPSPMTVWTPSGASSAVGTGAMNSLVNWVKNNPIAAVVGLGLGFFAIKGLKSQG